MFLFSIVLITLAIISMGVEHSTSTDHNGSKFPVVGSDQIMNKKAHGTCDKGVMNNLRWKCDKELADKISCYNRHYAEHSGYFWKDSNFMDYVKLNKEDKITFYDSVSGKPIFKAPVGRSMDEFIKESKAHGWPSFRDDEVIWENVRCLSNGETVSLDGTHLGHNLPDHLGNRYCINLVCIAGEGQTSVSYAPSVEVDAAA